MFASSGASDELQSFGSLDYWLRLRVPMAETVRLFREKAVAVDHVHSDPQVAAPFLYIDLFIILFIYILLFYS